MTKFANMLGVESSMADRQNSLSVALKSDTRNLRLAMKPFTNGSMLMPEILSRHLSEPIVTANDESIRSVIRRHISPERVSIKEHPAQILLRKEPGHWETSRVKAWRRYKSALSERPSLASSPNCSEKGLAQ